MSRQHLSRKSSSVTDLLDHVKYIISKNFDYVAVQGEISNFSRSSQGHYYLSLSDKKSLINAVIFRGDSMRISHIQRLKDGDVVDVVAELNLYERRGQVQLIIKKLSLVGEGDLKAKFEELKRKLFNEGLFDPSKKRQVSKYPRKVAVISAEGSAALEDFLNIHNRRSQSCDLVIIPGIMQGESSSKSIINALDKILQFQKINGDKFDAIVICRGGGSFEDLNSFNDESLARKVSAYPVPVISAIGHQTDYTILDFVADVRAETPSAAAEIVSEGEYQIHAKLNHLRISLESRINKFSNEVNRRLNLVNPINLQNIMRKKIKVYQDLLTEIKIFDRPEVVLGVYNYRQRLDESNYRLKKSFEKNLFDSKSRLKNAYDLLSVLNPNQVMERGYSIIKNEAGDVLSSKNEMIPNTKIKILQNDGESYAQIL